MSIQVENLSDSQLGALEDLIRAEELRREHLAANPEIAMSLMKLTEDELDNIGRLVWDEESRRADKTLQLQAAHEIEQGELRQELGQEDRRRLFVYRCARLFNLARLNAPEVVLAESLKLVNEAAPEKASPV